MATALIHFDEKQKRRLTPRARLPGKSFSQEVRDAVELYLSVSAETEAELTALARAANLAADGMLKRLDETIAYVDRTLEQPRNTN